MCIKRIDPVMSLGSTKVLVKKQPKRLINATQPAPNANIISAKSPAVLKSDFLANLVTVKVEQSDESVVESSVKLGTKAFIAILIHSRMCSGCPQSTCKKMKMVVNHYMNCDKITNGANCNLCRQLLKVISDHSRFLCNRDVRMPCPVPLCDVMRALRTSQRIDS